MNREQMISHLALLGWAPGAMGMDGGEDLVHPRHRGVGMDRYEFGTVTYHRTYVKDKPSGRTWADVSEKNLPELYELALLEMLCAQESLVLMIFWREEWERVGFDLML